MKNLWNCLLVYIKQAEIPSRIVHKPVDRLFQRWSVRVFSAETIYTKGLTWHTCSQGIQFREYREQKRCAQPWFFRHHPNSCVLPYAPQIFASCSQLSFEQKAERCSPSCNLALHKMDNNLIWSLLPSVPLEDRRHVWRPGMNKTNQTRRQKDYP